MLESFTEKLRTIPTKGPPRPELDWREPFLIPSSSADAIARQKILQREVTEIEKDLANKYKHFKFQTEGAYQRWRRKAIDAKIYRVAELRRLRAFLRAQSKG